MGERREDWNKPVDAVEAEGGDGGFVAGGEEGGLEKVENEKGGAEVGQCERAVVGWGFGVVRDMGWRIEFGLDVGYCAGEGFEGRYG